MRHLAILSLVLPPPKSSWTVPIPEDSLHPKRLPKYFDVFVPAARWLSGSARSVYCQDSAGVDLQLLRLDKAQRGIYKVLFDELLTPLVLHARVLQRLYQWCESG